MLLKVHGKRLLPYYFLADDALNSFVGLLHAERSGVERFLVLLAGVGGEWLLVVSSQELRVN